MKSIVFAAIILFAPTTVHANESKTDVIGKIIADHFAQKAADQAQTQKAAKAAALAASDVRLAEAKLAMK